MNLAPGEIAARGDLTDDAVLGGRLKLWQPAKGHRAGTDAILLAAAVHANATGLLVDIGAGVGTAGLAAALDRPALQVALIERDPLLASLARANAERNGLGPRTRVMETDLFDATGRDGADWVITNPPFQQSGRGREPQHPLKRAAYLQERALADWIRACLRLLKPGGIFAMIHRPDALPEILRSVEASLGGIVLCPVQPRDLAPATRVVLRGTRSSRAPLTLAPALLLHRESGRFTPEAERLHRGDGVLFS